MDGNKPTKEMLDFPGVEEGIRGMAFIDNVVASVNQKKSGQNLKYEYSIIK